MARAQEPRAQPLDHRKERRLIDPRDIERYERFLKYQQAIHNARDGLTAFTAFTMPDPKAPDDPERSQFLPARHLDVLADVMESVERGEILKAIISMPPRHGKTETATKRMNAWFAGRNPLKEIMTAAYGEVFAKGFAQAVRDIIRSRRFQQIFPDYFLVKDGGDQLINHLEKSLYFLGRRSPTTGRGGDLLLIDDPIKDEQEARSEDVRRSTWEWFTQTLLTRRHTDKAPFVITATRWHEDDVIGRLTDPTNPKYSAALSDGIEVVNLPAIAEDDDILGRKPGEALWPERFGVPHLQQMRDANPVSFSSLYQGDPTPAEGVFYQADDIHTYERGEMPDNLRMFAASDHAVSVTAANDPTCMGAFGISENGTAYVHPDLVWRRIQSDVAVEEMIRIMRTYKPMWWYAERGHISRALGPFLKRRMEEEEVYCPIIEDHPVSDKMQRAQSARARCAQGRILFPAFAPWWPRAKVELLKFPNARHDDFVDFVSIIGMKLQSHVAAGHQVTRKEPEPGTWGALKKEFAAQDRAAKTPKRGW